LAVPNIAFNVHDIAASRHIYKDLLGYAEPFDQFASDGKVTVAFIKINDRQYIELDPESTPDEPRFRHLALETDNAEGLRQYVKCKGYKVPDKPASRGRIRNTNYGLDDPDGNRIDINQYEPDRKSMEDVGKHTPAVRISTHMHHVGFYVSKPETARYYIDLLGFRESWRGNVDPSRAQKEGWSTKTASFSYLFCPEGADFIEFIFGPAPDTKEKKGGFYDMGLEFPERWQYPNVLVRPSGLQHDLCVRVGDI
jgi:lactoylglutathione lyase